MKHIDTFTYSIIIYQHTKLETHRNLIDPYLINLYTGNTVLIVGVSQAGFFSFFLSFFAGLCAQEIRNAKRKTWFKEIIAGEIEISLAKKQIKCKC